MAKLAWQSLRIVISMVQVVGQLGGVLHFDYTPQVQRIIERLRALTFELLELLHPTCYLGRLDVYQLWWLRVIAVPLLLVAVACARFIWQRSGVPGSRMREEAPQKLQSTFFFLLFITYPTICRRSFALLNCRTIGVDYRVVVDDYSVACDTHKWQFHRLCAAVVILLVGLGAPLGIYVRMSKAVRLATRASEGQAHHYVSQRMSEELRVPAQQMSDAVLDVVHQRSFSFLTSGFRGTCAFWEPVARMLNTGVRE